MRLYYLALDPTNVDTTPSEADRKPVLEKGLSILSLTFLDSIARIVESMTLLMEANMVDGEEAATINSEYVQASCLVTSGTHSMSFEAGEHVLFLHFLAASAALCYLRHFRAVPLSLFACMKPREVVQGQNLPPQIWARLFFAGLDTFFRAAQSSHLSKYVG